MSYTVIWTDTAEQTLTTVWLDANDRAAVTDAANEIDQRLRTDPRVQGESREKGRRILLVPPLGVKFRVLQPDCIVQVLHVWRFESRK